jgi:hypothetical protein
MMNGRQGATEGEEFSWTRLVPGEERLYDDTFSVYLVQVKSDSAIGKRMLVDPLEVFREKIPEMGIGDDDPGLRAQILRVNAEVPANPVRRSEVWMVYPGSTTAVGVQYKYRDEESQT